MIPVFREIASCVIGRTTTGPVLEVARRTVRRTSKLCIGC